MYKPEKSKLFGAALKKLLRKKNLSQREFAKRTKLQTSYVSKLVNGHIEEPRKDKRQKIAQGLGVTEQELQKITDEYSDFDIRASADALSIPLEAQITLQTERTSERRVDYTRLEALLKAGEWQKADRKTDIIMLKISGREENGWLLKENIKNFPCEDLHTINELWVKYSNGRFGFSVQKYIWQALVSSNESDLKIFQRFGDTVGWRVKCSWIVRVQNSIYAPKGHLPSLEFGVSRDYLEGLWEVEYTLTKVRSGPDGHWKARRAILPSLFSKITKCNMQ
ncbi:GUN4 domain-containing protein [Coleofasciculus sp. FACHB-1120]|uniref:GUN4 domain-containing protein n=1 Tax=Coleofasciculus sp. FACHB-1120 TaxID=2692783 RepID=UPI001688CB3F|nr:GUN4 domain-containing protein [Coleofasciculus sp. FACHB-1120]MBD2740029.1 GUN4 domain-containing protein [Coleofasciculus sp. FACHB-1120]